MMIKKFYNLSQCLMNMILKKYNFITVTSLFGQETSQSRACFLHLSNEFGRSLTLEVPKEPDVGSSRDRRQVGLRR